MSTTIGKVAYIATWDASQLVKGVMTSRQQFSAHRKIVESMKSPMDRHAQGLDNLNKLIEKYPNIAQHKLKLERDLERQYLSEKKSVEALTVAESKRLKVLGTGPASAGSAAFSPSASMLGLAKRALPIAGGLSAGFAAKELIRDAVLINARIERATAAMEVFTGSAAKAASMMNQLRSLSAESGIGFNAAQQGAATMMSFGVSVDRVLPAVRQLAEITRGDAERFGSMALAYAQAGAAGKLMGQDLLQMVNAGFNPLMEISRKTGKSISVLRDEMSRGEISFSMVEEAFRSATAEGGKFEGMMKKIGETTAGSLARVASEWEILVAKIGSRLAPVTQEASSGLIATLGEMNTVLSMFDEQVDRRMDAAKKSPGGKQAAFGMMSNIFGSTSMLGATETIISGVYKGYMRLAGSASLSAAAAINNDLDRRIEQYQQKHAAFSKMRESTPDQIAGPTPTQAGQDAINRLNIELGLVDKITARRQQLSSMGLNQAEIQRVMYLEKQLELIERQKSVQEKFEENRKKEMETLRERGRQVMKDLQTPMQAFRAEIADLILLNRSGAINQQTLIAGANAAAKRLPSEGPSDREAKLAPAIRSNSAEAYQFFAEMWARKNMPGKDDPQVQQVRLQQITTRLLQESNRVLEQIRDNQPDIGSDG